MSEKLKDQDVYWYIIQSIIIFLNFYFIKKIVKYCKLI